MPMFEPISLCPRANGVLLRSESWQETVPKATIDALEKRVRQVVNKAIEEITHRID